MHDTGNIHNACHDIRYIGLCDIVIHHTDSIPVPCATQHYCLLPGGGGGGGGSMSTIRVGVWVPACTVCA